MNFQVTINKKSSIIYLSLNSQGSSVNVLTHKVAKELNDFFDQLQPDDASLIVFQSKKPYSFLNGAELVLTKAVKDFSDIANFTRQTTLAYENVFRSPIPTVAAIQGNCFGCGLEFALCCDYRLASNTYDTCFYLTELKDYLILPLFGAIEKLPHIVGIEGAIDLLIFGKTWHANEALSKGLVDRMLSAPDFEQEVDNFLQELLITLPKKPSSRLVQRKHVTGQLLRLTKESEAQIRKKIYSLPPCQHMIHLKCLELLIKAASNGKGNLPVENTGKNTFDTIMSQASRNATSYFFIQAMAKVSSIGTSARIPDQDVKIILSSKKDDPFHDILRNRQVNGLSLLKETDLDNKQQINQPVSFYITQNEINASIPVRIAWGYEEEIYTGNQPLLYFPGRHVCDICEVHLLPDMISDLRPFLILLDHIGWQPVVTCVDERSPVNMLLHTYLEFVERVLNVSNQINVLNCSLWSFGFERLPADIAKVFLNKSLYGKDLTPGRYDDVFSMDLLQELYKTSLMILNNKWLRHTSQIDVLVRSLFGFPLANGSFCSFMKDHENDIGQPVGRNQNLKFEIRSTKSKTNSNI